jgi:NADH:ubiquinone oxidoreductase subunit 6 (subunit J)
MESDLVQSKSIDSDRFELLQQRILNSVAMHKSFGVKDLVVELQHTYSESLSVEEIQNAVKKLESEKKITLLEPGTKGHFFNYVIRSYNGLSLWLTTAATCLIIALVFLLPNIEPWSYMRMITGAVFVLFIPGNALVQLLFGHRNMEQTEQMVLSVGLSIALICIIGLMLKYILSALTVESAVISIGMLSITTSAVANYSHFLSSKKSE